MMIHLICCMLSTKLISNSLLAPIQNTCEKCIPTLQHHLNIDLFIVKFIRKFSAANTFHNRKLTNYETTLIYNAGGNLRGSVAVCRFIKLICKLAADNPTELKHWKHCHGYYAKTSLFSCYI